MHPGTAHRVALGTALPDLSASRHTLLVAASGGHLAQLVALRPRLGLDIDNVTWVTFETPQSRSLLAGENVRFVRFTAPRDFLAAFQNSFIGIQMLRSGDYDSVVSTGSLIAASFLPFAGRCGVSAFYIESAARVTGPSSTGRALARMKTVATHTQHAAWADERWRFVGSVFDGFGIQPTLASEKPLRVVVTLGTLKYPFPRLLKEVKAALPPNAEVLWQCGVTPTDGHGLPGIASQAMPAVELANAMANADVVVAHAGVGSALDSLMAGRKPILVPRRVELGEHIDDHQHQIAAELRDRDLAFEVTAESPLTPELFYTAAATNVVLEPRSVSTVATK